MKQTNTKWLNFDAILYQFLQLITKDKIKNVEHRVLARSNWKRVSAACLFYPSAKNRLTPYGPTKEFQSEDNPPI